jgi:putative ABC transport system permease protein
MKIIIKSIIRNFIRYPVTNLINLFGLSVSLSIVIILSTYCYSELTTDSFQKNAYETYLLKKSPDAIYLPGILYETIREKIPGLKSVVRITGSWEPPVFQSGNKEPLTSDLIFADEDFFKVFSYSSSEGDLNSALSEPMGIVITEGLAGKLFGKESALGKQIMMNNKNSLTIKAVIKDQKKNTCLNFSAVVSMATKNIVQSNGDEMKDWGWNNFQIFLLLDKTVRADDIIKNMVRIIPEKEQKNYSEASLVPLTKVYFSKISLFGSDHLRSGNRKKVMVLLFVAVLVLIIALINFINISSSQWQERVKQMGIMKVLGAPRSDIIRNVLAESLIFFLVSFIFALQIAFSLTSFISGYTGIIYNEKLVTSPYFIIISILVVFILSIVFSIIPALKIATSRAADNLKKTVRNNKTRYKINGALVTLQFSIAITLVAFTLLVQKQVRFGSNELGMNQNNIIGIKLTEQLMSKKDVLKEKLKGEPAINEVSFSQYFPGKVLSSWGTRLTLNGENKQVEFDTFCADEAFFKLLGLELVSGRFYSDDVTSDKGKIVVNETFVRKYNLTDPIGGTIMVGMMGENASPSEIIGVLKDFHYKPVNSEINALAIRNERQESYCLVHAQTENFNSLRKTMVDIKAITAELSASFPVEINFFDTALENMYNSELQFRRTFSLMSASAIIICCLGILAMSLSACQRRVKEIGIRKVNGARIGELLFMLNRDFIRWVVLAFVISTPVAWYIMNQWLKNYAYKTELSWWLFALAGLSALLIAVFTVSWQSWRTATRNPVEALRYE